MSSRYVLRRYDKSPTQPWLMAAYTEQVTSVPFEMDGIVAATLFVRDKFTRDRALKIGWKDETERYNAIIEKEKMEKEKQEAVVETFAAATPKRKRKK